MKLGHEATVHSWEISGDIPEDFVPSSSTDGSLFVSFHSTDFEGNLVDLLGVSEPAELKEIRHGMPTSISLGSAERVVAVLHTIDPSRAIGSAVFVIDDFRNHQQRKEKIPIEFEIAAFSRCYLSLTLLVVPDVRLLYFPGMLAVHCVNQGGHLILSRSDCSMEMAVVLKGHRTVVSERLRELEVSFVDEVAVVGCGERRMEVVTKLDPLVDQKVEIQLCEQLGGRLVDVIPLKSLQCDQPVIVGKREGFLVMTRNTAESPDLYFPPLTQIGAKSMAIVRKMTASLAIDFLPESVRGGKVEYCLVGSGWRDACNLEIASSVSITDDLSAYIDNVEIMCVDAIPVLGLVVRAASGKLAGIYTVPLAAKRGPLIFPGEDLVINVEIADAPERTEVPVLPRSVLTTPSQPPDMVAGSLVRVSCTLALVSGLPPAEGKVFVTVFGVHMVIPPILLSTAEVFGIREMSPAHEGLTCCDSVRREGRRSVIVFESEISVDVAWGEEQWLYFVVYRLSNDATVAVGQTCFSLKNGEFERDVELPIVDPVSPHSRELQPRLSLRFRKHPQIWSAIRIFQNPAQHRDASEGSFRLDVEVFLGEDQTVPAVRSGHSWLPIKDFLPLFIRNCPPRGSVRFRLSTLAGRIIADTSLALTERSKESIAVGKFAFRLAREGD